MSGSPYHFKSADTGSLVLIQSQTVTNQARASFTTGLDITYSMYLIEVYNIVPQTDATQLNVVFSVDGGSNWLNADYQHTRFANANGSAMAVAGSGSDSVIALGGGLGSATGESFAGRMWLYNPSGAVNYKMIAGDAVYYSSGPNVTRISFGGAYTGAQTAINAISFIMSSGNINGTFVLYGMRS